MSIVTSFQARLKAIDPAIFRIVEGAAEFASISDAPKTYPAAYVFVEGEASEANNRAMGGPVLQRMEMDVAVVIITRHVGDARGDAAAVEIEALKAQVRAALLGFVPDAEIGEPVEHVSGELLKARGGWVWHRELFSIATYIGEAE